MRLLQSLTRGLHALDYMSGHDTPVRLTDIAAALGVEKSNASHILKTLVAAGYARQDARRRYQATDRIASTRWHGHTLEQIVACREAWRPALETLVARTGECAHLAVIVRSRVWYVDKIDSVLPLKVDHPIGSLAPLHCTALGKAFLGFGAAVAEAPLESYTPRTITVLADLEEENRRTRRRGYAVDDEEYAKGVRCVARPVFDSDGRMIAAVGVSGPTVRIDDERIAELGEIICGVNSAAWVESAP